jgi:hypothetical protein
MMLQHVSDEEMLGYPPCSPYHSTVMETRGTLGMIECGAVRHHHCLTGFVLLQ